MLYRAVASLFVAALLTTACTAQVPFERLDRNSDGEVTRSELPERARQLFDRIDADKDGKITKSEHNAAMRQLRNRTGQQGRIPQNLEVERNIAYADTENRRQMLDIAIPKEPTVEGPLPVLVYIHGGGWKNGSKDQGIRRLSSLLESGKYAGVSVGYRLTDEATWPAQIHDCQAAIRWIKANAEKRKLDPKRIVIWGTSAGGHLVAMLGVSADVEELDGKLGPHKDQTLEVAGVVDYFGPANFWTMGDEPQHARHNLSTSPEALLLGGAIKENPETAKSASPITHVTKNDSPILIMHGSADPTVPFSQSTQFHAALKKAGVDSTLIEVVGAGHGFGGTEVQEKFKLFLSKIIDGKEVDLKDDKIKLQSPQRRQ